MPNPPHSDLPRLEFRSAAEWRAWLAANHASSPGVWFVFHKAHTGEATIRYDEAVEEALCFGWIDSLAKRWDEERYLQKFTPRRDGSRWSESNLERIRRLIRAGRMTPAGMIHTAGAETRKALGPQVSEEVPRELKSAMRNEARTRARFEALPPGYRKTCMRWINSARRPETRARRIAEFLERTKRGERIGLK